MYNPSLFRVEDPELLHAVMAEYPLATLVTLSSEDLCASHLPLFYDEGGGGVLRGHMAKANPQWSHLAVGARALAIFTGPQHYITPSWYPSTAEHGKVVPTWNYVAVHARGAIRVIHDPAWLKQNVRELTAVQEARFANPWNVERAPEAYIDDLLQAIVGIEITIETLEGKWKASQNRPDADTLGVIAGLRALQTPEADQMADIVARCHRDRARAKQGR